MTKPGAAERARLASQRLGRVATTDPRGTPQADPVGLFPRLDDTV
ncbi:pyridoxamine 5'-phosphate oxidase family protein [Streptomyces sp. NPDC007088]